MAGSRKTRCFNFFLNKGVPTEGVRARSTWNRWLQLFTGIVGFLVFVSYGAYILPVYDQPITLACFFVSGVGLLNAVLGLVKLVIAHRMRKKGIASKNLGDIEICNLESRANGPTKNNDVPGLTMSTDEAEELRHILRQALPPRGVRHTGGVPDKKPPGQQDQLFLTFSPAKPGENRTNPHWKIHRFPSANNLRRTESYDSKLKFHQSYSSEVDPSFQFISAQKGTFSSSSSDRDIYIYSSSSDGTSSSIYGWRMNHKPLKITETHLFQPEIDLMPHKTEDVEHLSPSGPCLSQLPLDLPEAFPALSLKITEPNLFQTEIDLVPHKTEDVEHLSSTAQCLSQLPLDLPESFPALPFPKRDLDDYRGNIKRQRQKSSRERINNSVPTVASMTESRSMINIGNCESKSKKELLTILANFSSVVSSPVQKKQKCSHNRRCKKHFAQRNLNMLKV